MTPPSNQGCLDRSEPRTASVRTATGALIYLLEELGDARVRADQVQRYVQEALDLVQDSSHRDHFYEVAGHVIEGLPKALFLMSKALNAAALAASHMDYESLRKTLQPGKVDELEALFDKVRIRTPLRLETTKEPVTAMSEPTTITPDQAQAALNDLASTTESSGQVPLAKLAGLIEALESGYRSASTTEPAKAVSFFRTLASHAKAGSSRLALAHRLRAVLAQEVDAGAGQEFQKVNPKITDEEVKEIDKHHEENKDVVKDKAEKSAAVYMIPGELRVHQTSRC